MSHFLDVCIADDKTRELDHLIRQHDIDTKECVLVNDSNIEKLAAQDKYDDLRIVTPDALELLGREETC